MALADKVKDTLKKIQDKGIPVPVLQDPISKLPSVTFTFFLVSGIVCLLASFDGVKSLASIDFSEIKEFFDMTMWAYLGRSAIKASLGVPGVNNNKEEKKENE